MSTTGYGPPQRIDGPPPLPPKYGLVPSVPIIKPPIKADGTEDPHWLNGAAIYPYPPDCAKAFNSCSTEQNLRTKQLKDYGDTVPNPIFQAFPVYLPITCSTATVGADAQGWFENRAAVALAAVESQAVEAEFASGYFLPLNPHLTDGNLWVLNLSGAVGPVEGLAMLEDAIATTCRQGVIHVDPMTATSWAALYLIHDDHGVLRTSIGTLVVVGQGYRQQIPDSQGQWAPDDPLASCTAWAFATGPVQITRSEIFTMPERYDQALDRSSNILTFRAERYYLVDWDTVLQAGVLIDRDIWGCGESNGGS